MCYICGSIFKLTLIKCIYSFIINLLTFKILASNLVLLFVNIVLIEIYLILKILPNAHFKKEQCFQVENGHYRHLIAIAGIFL